jgi:hypothetical protein
VILNYGRSEVTRTIGLQGKRIETLLTHSVATPEANSFDVATILPAARLLAQATNCPWARRVELQQRSVESPHRFGGAEEKPTLQRAAHPDVSCDRLLVGCGGLIGSTPRQTVRAYYAVGRHLPRRLRRDVIRRGPTANRPVWGGLPAVQAVRTGRPLAFRRDIRQILGGIPQRSGPGVRSPSGWLPQLP